MGKNKLKKFAENETFENLVQPDLGEAFQKEYFLKGQWNQQFFRLKQPLVLEVGCGKGEYTIGMAEKYPEKNFIGIDIKGARIWKGAKYGVEQKIINAGFLRTRIEFIDSFFAENEVDEIWITFPDPQLKKRRIKKRLTGPVFLNKYQKFLKNNGIVHLKTDNTVLYEYTLALLKHNELEIIKNTNDLYLADFYKEELLIQTHYEKLFSEQGNNIKYLKFCLKKQKDIIDLPNDEG